MTSEVEKKTEEVKNNKSPFENIEDPKSHVIAQDVYEKILKTLNKTKAFVAAVEQKYNHKSTLNNDIQDLLAELQ